MDGVPAQIESMAEADRELFDLLWYHGLSQAEAGNLLGVSERTINKRWIAARCGRLSSSTADCPINVALRGGFVVTDSFLYLLDNGSLLGSAKVRSGGNQTGRSTKDACRAFRISQIAGRLQSRLHAATNRRASASRPSTSRS